MIIEEKRELIDKNELYQKMAQKMNDKKDGATLTSSLNLKEILEIFNELTIYEEPGAVWILDDYIWRCSNCKMAALESFGKSFPSRCCPYCGRRMRIDGKEQNEN